MKKVRESNIELLRILAMLGVVVMHFNGEPGKGFEYVAQGSVNHGILLTVESGAICAVNLFMLITGYFSVTTQKRDLAKALYLVLQVSVFRVAYVLVAGLLSGSLAIRSLIGALLPVNYFVILYVAVYLLSPYLNLALQKLTDRGRLKLLLLALALLSVWPTLVELAQDVLHVELAGLSTIGLDGSGSGYTLTNFLLMYLVGAVLRLNCIRWRKGIAGAVLLSCVILLTLWCKLLPGTAWMYCNPLVILQTMAAFLLVQNLSFTSKAVNQLASATFTCYLVHTYFLPLVDVRKAVQGSPVLLVGILLATSVGIYLISWVCSVVYSVVEKPVRALLARVLRKIDLSVEEVS